MRKVFAGLRRDERGGTEILAIALIAALVLALVLGYGKEMFTKTGTKMGQMGNCIENPNGAGC